ncbi:hypothetical protein KHS38_14235 [Mucilaginibacter sp. Bleaf8]|uniref:hypothetical protein n=1 Tax=Mucilaginibacter sp. Bleaf8 TaxID=2834430 RepID=UPI001BCCDAD3|nr:hypothetical protein [Mucilaginibacter sp. Bleaf8]MBS7565568.1 hypothetical protein [Mucilaginibacter sp. Bleaf8]
MWRKIHSNRDPKDTLYSEIRKEFSVYFGFIADTGQRLFAAYPRIIFGLMVVSMLASFALSLTVFRNREGSKKTPEKNINTVQDGFSQIMQATGNIRETLRLKSLVDSLSAKKVLAVRDSMLLDSALDRLAEIHRTLK